MARSKRKDKVFPEEQEQKKVQALKAKINEQSREIKRLKAKLKTLNEAFEKSAAFMSDESKDLTPQELIKAAEKHTPLAEIKKRKSVADERAKAEEEKQKTIKKWQDWRNSLPIPPEDNE